MKLLALTILSVMLFLPLHAVTIVAVPFAPVHFSSLYLESDEGKTSTVIQLARDEVTYTKTVEGKVVDKSTVNPSGDDWFQFIQGLNGAKVYKWAPKYEYPGQGASWVIDLVMADRKFASEGSNDYPKEGAEDQPQADPKAGPSMPFQLFWQAALQLAGKAPTSAPAK